jgi:D-amino-acid dehydrogenase
MSKVVIVGGGINGLSAAYYLQKRGHEVTIIDRGDPATANCSFGNAGYVSPSHIVPLAAPGMVMMGLKWMRDPESPFYVRPRLAPDLISWGWQFYRAGTKAHVDKAAPVLCELNMASRACYEELNDILGDSFCFAHKGLLMIFKNPQALEHEIAIAERANELGLKTEVLDAAQTQARNPSIRQDVCGSVFFADDCHMAPFQMMARLQQHLEKAGVQFQWKTEVTGWKRDGRKARAIVTEDAEIEGDEFVLCGGSWSSGMVKSLGLKMPIQAGKGYSLTLPKPRFKMEIPAILVERRVAVTPMGNQLRFAGTMEIAGLNTDVNPARIRGIKKSVPLYFPDFTDEDFQDVQPWVGLRPCSPDGLPYVGRTRRYDNLSIGAGHAMLGLSLGPITGLLLAQTISGEKPQVISSMLDPDRYG